jgi:hypothetical protein
MSNDLLRDKWSSLGIAFSTTAKLNANPELTIIETIKSHEFPSDKKMFSLMLLWLEEYLELVHVERLKNLLKDLSAYELALLGGIALKCLNKGDHRWKMIILLIQKKIGKKEIHFNDGNDDDLLLKMKGVDKEFLKFGIRVVPLKSEDHKKLLRREVVLGQNAWLKNRLLFGPNLRADFMTVFALSLASNAYQAAKLLGCSMNASYRNWKSIDEASKLGFLN